MMEKEELEQSQTKSSGLFNNKFVLPVASAIDRRAQDDETFVIRDIKEELGGRAADNQIRDALKRIVSTGAVKQLTSLGPPHPDVWERHAHPFWQFVRTWHSELLAPDQSRGN